MDANGLIAKSITDQAARELLNESIWPRIRGGHRELFTQRLKRPIGKISNRSRIGSKWRFSEPYLLSKNRTHKYWQLIDYNSFVIILVKMAASGER